MLIKKESPAKSVRTHHIADEIAGNVGRETRCSEPLRKALELKNGAQKSRDPLRGPLGSLIARAQQDLFQKSASPIAFCRAVAHALKCTRGASGGKRLLETRLSAPTGSRQSVCRPGGCQASAGTDRANCLRLLSDRIATLSVRILEQLEFGNEFRAEV
jgi:hypothetical protein